MIDLRMTSANASVTVKCHSAAVWGSYHDKQVLGFSVTGADASIKAIRAVLHEKKVRAGFKFDGDWDKVSSYSNHPRYQGKYRTETARLDLDTVHMIALAEDDRILKCIDDEALWQELTSERYTTPLLRHWIPWIRQRLEHGKLLKKATCYNCNIGWLRITTKQLDALATQGVQGGMLSLTKEDRRNEKSEAVGAGACGSVPAEGNYEPPENGGNWVFP